MQQGENRDLASLRPPSPPAEIANMKLPTQGNHGVLKRYVRDQHMWYVNLHTTKTIDDMSNMVVIFCVGVSSNYPHRLVGLISAQVCHSYCD